MRDLERLAEDITENPDKYAQEMRKKLGKIKYLDELKLSRFIEEEEFWRLKEVNINNIVGTCHYDYANLYWADMLLHGKRMHINLRQLKDNPSYYLEKDEKKPIMEYLEINGKIYVYGEGNHRTAIAKVLLNLLGITSFGKVCMRHWKVNYRAMELEKIARQRGIFVDVKRVKVLREDDENYYKDTYKILFSTSKGDLTIDDFEEFLTQKSFL